MAAFFRDWTPGDVRHDLSADGVLLVEKEITLQEAASENLWPALDRFMPVFDVQQSSCSVTASELAERVRCAQGLQQLTILARHGYHTPAQVVGRNGLVANSLFHAAAAAAAAFTPTTLVWLQQALGPDFASCDAQRRGSKPNGRLVQGLDPDMHVAKTVIGYVGLKNDIPEAFDRLVCFDGLPGDSHSVGPYDLPMSTRVDLAIFALHLLGRCGNMHAMLSMGVARPSLKALSAHAAKGSTCKVATVGGVLSVVEWSGVDWRRLGVRAAALLQQLRQHYERQPAGVPAELLQLLASAERFAQQPCPETGKLRVLCGAHPGGRGGPPAELGTDIAAALAQLMSGHPLSTQFKHKIEQRAQQLLACCYLRVPAQEDEDEGQQPAAGAGGSANASSSAAAAAAGMQQPVVEVYGAPDIRKLLMLQSWSSWGDEEAAAMHSRLCENLRDEDIGVQLAVLTVFVATGGACSINLRVDDWDACLELQGDAFNDRVRELLEDATAACARKQLDMQSEDKGILLRLYMAHVGSKISAVVEAVGWQHLRGNDLYYKWLAVAAALLPDLGALQLPPPPGRDLSEEEQLWWAPLLHFPLAAAARAALRCCWVFMEPDMSPVTSHALREGYSSSMWGRMQPELVAPTMSPFSDKEYTITAKGQHAHLWSPLRDALQAHWQLPSLTGKSVMVKVPGPGYLLGDLVTHTTNTTDDTLILTRGWALIKRVMGLKTGDKLSARLVGLTGSNKPVLEVEHQQQQQQQRPTGGPTGVPDKAAWVVLNPTNINKQLNLHVCQCEYMGLDPGVSICLSLQSVPPRPAAQGNSSSSSSAGSGGAANDLAAAPWHTTNVSTARNRVLFRVNGWCHLHDRYASEPRADPGAQSAPEMAILAAYSGEESKLYLLREFASNEHRAAAAAAARLLPAKNIRGQTAAAQAAAVNRARAAARAAAGGGGGGSAGAAAAAGAGAAAAAGSRQLLLIDALKQHKGMVAGAGRQQPQQQDDMGAAEGGGHAAGLPPPTPQQPGRRAGGSSSTGAAPGAATSAAAAAPAGGGRTVFDVLKPHKGGGGGVKKKHSSGRKNHKDAPVAAGQTFLNAFFAVAGGSNSSRAEAAAAAGHVNADEEFARQLQQQFDAADTAAAAAAACHVNLTRSLPVSCSSRLTQQTQRRQRQQQQAAVLQGCHHPARSRANSPSSRPPPPMSWRSCTPRRWSLCGAYSGLTAATKATAAAVERGVRMT